MFTPGHINSQTVSMKILSDSQLEDIVQAAFTIVESTGFKVSKKEARESLKKAGTAVIDDLAYVPRAIQNKAFFWVIGTFTERYN